MIKRFAIKKIIVTSFCLLLLLLFYFFPTHESINYEIINSNDNMHEGVVYLLDKDNYVSKLITYFDNKTIEDEIKNRLEVLINGNENLIDFYTLIPRNTKINSVKVDKNKVYVDFNEEIVKVNKYIEESMIEAIVYTLTEINGIDEVYLSVNGNKLLKSFNYNDSIPYPLTREYGINKEYNLTSFNSINKTTVFFSKDEDNITYYVPITKINNSSDDKIDIIIEELKSVVNAQNDLNSYINDLTKVVSYEIKDDTMNIVFNKYILSNNIINDEVEYIISNSIFENYDVNKIIFNTESNKNISVVSKSY